MRRISADSKLHASDPILPLLSQYSVVRILDQVPQTLLPAANTKVSDISSHTRPRKVPSQCWNGSYYYK